MYNVCININWNLGWLSVILIPPWPPATWHILWILHLCACAGVLHVHYRIYSQMELSLHVLHKYLSYSCNGKSCHKYVHECPLIWHMFSHLILKYNFSFSFYPSFHLVFSLCFIAYLKSKGYCSYEASINMGWGKSRFIWNTVYSYIIIFIYCIIFHMNNCKPTFATH